MNVAVRSNVRTTAAAQQGLNRALRVAFSSGGVMGLSVVGIGILGITLMWWVFKDPNIVAGFGMGASSIALFARVGGGIFTKAADVGGDLVGKIEQGIPEDDPRNPATIADNVGDNVGDVAGMGADLFESYVGSIIAAIALAVAAGGAVLVSGNGNPLSGTGGGDEFNSNIVLLPILVAAIGIFASIIGTFLVRTGEDASMGKLLQALRTGIFGAGALVLIGTGLAVAFLDLDFNLFWVVVVGLVVGQVIGIATEWFTSYEYRWTKGLSNQANTGPATVIINGFSLGMLSTLIPMIAIVVGIWVRLLAGRSLRRGAGRGGDALHAGYHPGHRRLRPRRRQRRRPSPSSRGSPKRCAIAPTPSTRWATPPPRRVRASPSAPPSSPRWPCSRPTPRSSTKPGAAA